MQRNNWNNRRTQVEIVDARNILAARRNQYPQNDKRSNINRQNFNRKQRFYSNSNNNNYARSNYNKDADFTIPIKTVRNNFYAEHRPISTNKNFSGTNFSNPKKSMGMFSHAIKEIESLDNARYNKRSLNEPHDEVIKPKRKSYEGKFNLKEDMEKFRPVITIKNDQMNNLPIKIKNESETIVTKKPGLSTSALLNRKPNVIDSKSDKIAGLVSPIQGYRIEIKNLHPQVTVDDVYELFTSLNGELRSCNLIRPGYAEVVFKKLKDAQRSIDEFHGRDLDRKPMNLKLVTPAIEPSNLKLSTDTTNKIASIQMFRKPSLNLEVDKDAVYRSLFSKSLDTLKSGKKSYKFSVTL